MFSFKPVSTQIALVKLLGTKSKSKLMKLEKGMLGMRVLIEMSRWEEEESDNQMILHMYEITKLNIYSIKFIWEKNGKFLKAVGRYLNQWNTYLGSRMIRVQSPSHHRNKEWWNITTIPGWGRWSQQILGARWLPALDPGWIPHVRVSAIKKKIYQAWGIKPAVVFCFPLHIYIYELIHTNMHTHAQRKMMKKKEIRGLL